MLAGPNVSIIIPVIRPQKIGRCIDAITQNTPSEGFLTAVQVGRIVYYFEIIIREDTFRIGCPKMVKQLVEQSRGQIVAFLGDDTIPEHGWLSEALKAMATLPDGYGLVGLNDQHNGPDLPTHWLADKRLLPLLDGEFFHTGYRHTHCDMELHARCVELGRYVWAENAKIIHDHPAMTGMSDFTGTDYEWQYRADNYLHDRRLFRKRQRNGWK